MYINICRVKYRRFSTLSFIVNNFRSRNKLKNLHYEILTYLWVCTSKHANMVNRFLFILTIDENDLFCVTGIPWGPRTTWDAWTRWISGELKMQWCYCCAYVKMDFWSHKLATKKRIQFFMRHVKPEIKYSRFEPWGGIWNYLVLKVENNY